VQSFCPELMHVIALVLLLVSLASVACGERARQTLTLSGSTSIQPLAEKWAEVYRKRHPGVTIAVQGGGSTAGVQASRSGAAQIGLSSRPLTDTERREVHAIQVARDGIALVVHPRNPLESLSRQAVRDIYSGDTKNWRGARGLARPITVITREEGSGTRAAFESLVMNGKLITAGALVQDSTGAVRQMVSSDPGAIGYVSIGLVDTSVKALRLDEVPATEANIDLGTYPLVRPFLFVLQGEPNPPTRAFVAWVLGAEGRELARHEGLLPPNEEGARAYR